MSGTAVDASLQEAAVVLYAFHNDGFDLVSFIAIHVCIAVKRTKIKSHRQTKASGEHLRL